MGIRDFVILKYEISNTHSELSIFNYSFCIPVRPEFLRSENGRIQALKLSWGEDIVEANCRSFDPFQARIPQAVVIVDAHSAVLIPLFHQQLHRGAISLGSFHGRL